MTLKDAVDSLYRRYGSYGESVMSLSMPGADGNERMREIMERLRENAPATLGGDSVVSVRDYLKGTVTDLVTGKTEPTGLPSSDVLYYTTRAAVTVFRPSGTEPKIKVYFMAKGENSDAVSEKLAACRADAGKLLGK